MSASVAPASLIPASLSSAHVMGGYVAVVAALCIAMRIIAGV